MAGEQSVKRGLKTATLLASGSVTFSSLLSGILKTDSSGVLSVDSSTYSFTGTTNRISVSTGVSTSIDISSAYIGQTSITTVGTISSGTWNGTTISTLKGGTGLTSFTAGDLIYSSATNTLNKLPIGTNNSVLKIISGLPSWQVLTPTNISVFNETPSGFLNGINTVFTIANNFITNSTQLFLNGQRLRLGSAFDYTESAPGQITFIIPPFVTDNLIIDYIF